MAKKKSPPWKLTWPALAPLATACAQPSAPPAAEPDRLPVLPAQGRASLVPIPSDCLPTCSSGLTRERNESAALLTGSASLAKPASNTPTEYSLATSRPASK